MTLIKTQKCQTILPPLTSLSHSHALLSPTHRRSLFCRIDTPTCILLFFFPFSIHDPAQSLSIAMITQPRPSPSPPYRQGESLGLLAHPEHVTALFPLPGAQARLTQVAGWVAECTNDTAAAVTVALARSRLAGLCALWRRGALSLLAKTNGYFDSPSPPTV